MLPVQIFIFACASYLVGGCLFAAWFLTRGIGRMDPGAHKAPRLFRVLIAPGVVALWPLLLRRFNAAREVTHPNWARATRRRHLIIWITLAVLIPAGMVAGLLGRESLAELSATESTTIPERRP